MGFHESPGFPGCALCQSQEHPRFEKKSKISENSHTPAREFSLLSRVLDSWLDSESSTRLNHSLSTHHDSKATLKFEAPASKVREWLYTPECSDLKQLGASQGTQDPKDLNMWDCQQPAIDFLGLNLQPYFVSRLERQARDYDNDDDDDDDDNDDGTVTVSVVDSRIEILNKNNPAARSVASIMRRAKFTGTRITILVKRVVDDDDDDDDDDDNNESQCKLSVDLTLRLHVPLPPSFFLSFSLYKTQIVFSDALIMNQRRKSQTNRHFI